MRARSAHGAAIRWLRALRAFTRVRWCRFASYALTRRFITRQRRNTPRRTCLRHEWRWLLIDAALCCDDAGCHAELFWRGERALCAARGVTRLSGALMALCALRHAHILLDSEPASFRRHYACRESAAAMLFTLLPSRRSPAAATESLPPRPPLLPPRADATRHAAAFSLCEMAFSPISSRRRAPPLRHALRRFRVAHAARHAASPCCCYDCCRAADAACAILRAAASSLRCCLSTSRGVFH